jgi:ribosomal protein S18 acetylase RimI-like enzyme
MPGVGVLVYNEQVVMHSTSKEIVIRRLRPEEWAAYRELRLEGLKKDPQAFGASYERNRVRPDSYWQERLANVATGNWLLFAEAEGRLVGMAGAWVDAVEDVADIISVYVTPGYRGKGVGRELLKAVLREISTEPKIQKARLTVNREQTPAIALYRAFGFEVVDEIRSEMGDGKIYDEYVMELVMSPY